MNLFENLQIIKESGGLMSNDEFVKNECEKYDINEYSYGTNYKMLGLNPTDSDTEEFIKKIEADGYKLLDTQKDGIENHISENDVTLVYGKEVESNRCLIAITIHPSEDYVAVSCGYDEMEHDNEFFENLQLMNESIDLGENQSKDDTTTYYTFTYNNQKYSFSECSNEYKVISCRNKDYIRGVYPYDNAEHPWAYSNHNDTKWNIVKAGKVIDTINSDDLEPVVQLLQKYDKDVEPRIDRT